MGAENAGAQDAIAARDADANLSSHGSGGERDNRKLSVQIRGAQVRAEFGSGADDGRNRGRAGRGQRSSVR